MPKGVYVRTVEARANIAAAMRGKRRGAYGPRDVPAWNKGVPVTEEARSKMRAAKLKNPTRYWLGSGRSGHSGKPHTPEAKTRIIESNRRSFDRRDHARDGKHRHLYRGIAFRSSYEVRAAMAWDALGVDWLYEPRVFRLSDGSRYQPDFYHPSSNYWTEVKGFCADRARRKMEMFRAEVTTRFSVLMLDGITLLEHQVQLLTARRAEKEA